MSTINRIAAGEIIQRPVNVVKEIMENSLDAGSSHIHITIVIGGLELIKIKDDGHGIHFEDLPLVCERYATSKIKDFRDLSFLNTFGFRGEALASISHVADVTVVSKTDKSLCGYQAIYKDGKLVCKPMPCASNDGTTVIVQNLFANIAQRRKSFKSPLEEYKRIQRCVESYAVHHYQHGFTLKQDAVTDLLYEPTSNQITRVQKVYGKSMSSHIEIIEHTSEDFSLKLLYSTITTNSSIEKVKSSIFITFVNNRLVENTQIKKGLKKAYKDIDENYSPSFLYVSLHVRPDKVDANIHPTKNEVRLLHEEDIVQELSQILHDALKSSLSKNTSTKAFIPLKEQSTLDYYFKAIKNDNTIKKESNSLHLKQKPSKLTSERQKITVYKEKPLVFQKKMPNGSSNKESEKIMISLPTSFVHSDSGIDNVVPDMTRRAEKKKEDMENINDLESVQTLRREIKAFEDKNISKLIASQQLVHYIDDNLAMTTSKGRYFLMNPSVISEELFYQIFISQLGQLGKIKLSLPLPIRDMLELMSQNENEIRDMVKTIVLHREILDAYFKFSITKNGQIVSLPMVIKGYVPSLDKLPIFLHNIAIQVGWDDELNCLYTLARELGLFYCSCSKDQCELVLKAIRQSKLCVPRYIGSSCYFIELDFPNLDIN